MEEDSGKLAAPPASGPPGGKSGTTTIDALLAAPAPILALAPMQDITDLPFLRLMARYGGADLYFTEYFRVHGSATPDRYILRSITENPTGRPIIAQMIGNDIPALVKMARALERHAVAGIDLNLGCPAPVVYRKCAGGGLLRFPDKVDAIVGALREAVTTRFTVKTRIGFDDPAVFDRLLEIFARHRPDLVTVHGRTVLEMYRPVVHRDFIARAVAALPCPVLANGGVDSPDSALAMLRETGARGVMIGRGAIRNPWLFAQVRAALRGETAPLPRGRDVLAYLHDLYESLQPEELREAAYVQKLKKHLNFVGAGVHAEFLHEIRRVGTAAEFFAVCRAHLEHDAPMALTAGGAGPVTVA